MIGSNKKKVSDVKVKGKAGGLANESRFGSNEREMRTRKVITIPSVNTNSALTFEQAWTRQSARADVVRITLGDMSIIVSREELEQGISVMAQGGEIIKYQHMSANKKN